MAWASFWVSSLPKLAFPGLPATWPCQITLDHFTSLTHTQTNLDLCENEKKLFLAAPSGSVTAEARLEKKEFAQGQSAGQQQRGGSCLPRQGWVA